MARLASLDDLASARVLSALSQHHREEIAQLRALLVRWREHMEQHGLQPPDDTGAEALLRFQAALKAAGVNDPLQYHEWREGSWFESNSQAQAPGAT